MPAILMGFFQIVIAIVVEILVIIFLSSLGNLIEIIMKFVSLAAVTKFDDMYAKAIFENKIQKTGGKIIPITFERRRFRNMGKEDQEIHNPHKGCCLKFWRVVYKILRMYYLSFNYYFAAYFAMWITFMMTINNAGTTATIPTGGASASPNATQDLFSFSRY